MRIEVRDDNGFSDAPSLRTAKPVKSNAAAMLSWPDTGATRSRLPMHFATAGFALEISEAWIEWVC